MKWDRLRLFNIVVQTGNITHASSILNVSQPALSRQIKSLEDEILGEKMKKNKNLIKKNFFINSS